jgi:hypothetical protein
MFRPQLRQITLRCEAANYGLAKPARQFSCTRTVAEDENQPSGKHTRARALQIQYTIGQSDNSVAESFMLLC